MTQNIASGVVSMYSLQDWIHEELTYNSICPLCNEWINDINNDIELNEEQRYKELDMLECFEHNLLIGDWIKDENGLYIPDTNGNNRFSAEYMPTFNAILVYWSDFTKLCGKCSPCFPFSGDIDTNGNILSYTLPDDYFIDR